MQDEEPAKAYFPAGHREQLDMPAEPWALPAWQATHADARTCEYFPSAHGEQAEAPVGDTIPAAQAPHTEAAGSAYVPAEHLAQLVDPVEPAYKPRAQTEQTEDEAVAVKLAFAQAEQDPAPANETKPAAQAKQADEPAEEYLPVKHEKQVWPPVAEA